MRSTTPVVFWVTTVLAYTQYRSFLKLSNSDTLRFGIEPGAVPDLQAAACTRGSNGLWRSFPAVLNSPCSEPWSLARGNQSSCVHTILPSAATRSTCNDSGSSIAVAWGTQPFLAADLSMHRHAKANLAGTHPQKCSPSQLLAVISRSVSRFPR